MPVTLEVGLARDPAVSYQGTNLPPLWKSYLADTRKAMVADAYDGRGRSPRTAPEALDAQIVSDARAANGDHYAALCTLSLRQAFGGTELVGTTAKPWLFLKEISSDGNISTVDVVYPASPVFLYTNPYLLKLMLLTCPSYDWDAKSHASTPDDRLAFADTTSARATPSQTAITTAAARTCRSKSRPTCFS